MPLNLVLITWNKIFFSWQSKFKTDIRCEKKLLWLHLHLVIYKVQSVLTTKYVQISATPNLMRK